MDTLDGTQDDADVHCFTGGFIETNCWPDYFTQIMVVSYYSLTTLSTIGYGDLFPISSREQLIGIIFMLFGIVFFSQIMGSFIEII